MPKPQIEKHIHKLKRIRFKSGNTFYFCTLPDCTFKINPALALGKRSICWRCGSEFLLNEYALRLAKPHCEGCHKPKTELVPPPFPENRRIKQGEIPNDNSPSLIERLQQALSKNKTSEAEAEEDI